MRMMMLVDVWVQPWASAAPTGGSRAWLGDAGLRWCHSPLLAQRDVTSLVAFPVQPWPVLPTAKTLCQWPRHSPAPPNHPLGARHSTGRSSGRDHLYPDTATCSKQWCQYPTLPWPRHPGSSEPLNTPREMERRGQRRRGWQQNAGTPLPPMGWDPSATDGLPEQSREMH